MKFSFVNGKLVTTTKIGNTEFSISSDGDTAVSHKIGKHFSVGLADGKSFTATHLGNLTCGSTSDGESFTAITFGKDGKEK